MDGAAIAIAEAEKLTTSDEPEVRRAGIAALAIHRHSSVLFDAAVADAAPRVAARALRAAGELGRVDLVGPASDRLKSPDAECRVWAAWSVVRLHGPSLSTALATLREFVDSNDPRAEQAVAIAFRVIRLDEGHAWRRLLAADPATARSPQSPPERWAIPAAISDLLEQMAESRDGPRRGQSLFANHRRRFRVRRPERTAARHSRMAHRGRR